MNETEADDGSQVTTALQSTSQQAHKLFGFMKDGAGSLLKKIKDSSSTVAQQVARWSVMLCVSYWQGLLVEIWTFTLSVTLH